MTGARRMRGSESPSATTGVGSRYCETRRDARKGAAVARTIPMPSKEELPDGPRRAFVTELRRYYRVARPSLREISQAIERHTDPRLNKVTASAETVRRMITGKVLPSRSACTPSSACSATWRRSIRTPSAGMMTADTTTTPTPRATGSTSGGYGTPPWKTSPTPRPSPGRPRLRPSLTQQRGTRGPQPRATTRGIAAAATPTSRPSSLAQADDGSWRAASACKSAPTSSTTIPPTTSPAGTPDSPAQPSD